MTNPWDRVFGVKWHGSGGAGADHAEEMLALEEEEEMTDSRSFNEKRLARRFWGLLILMWVILGVFAGYTISFYRDCNGVVVRGVIGWACVPDPTTGSNVR